MSIAHESTHLKAFIPLIKKTKKALYNETSFIYMNLLHTKPYYVTNGWYIQTFTP